MGVQNVQNNLGLKSPLLQAVANGAFAEKMTSHLFGYTGYNYSS